MARRMNFGRRGRVVLPHMKFKWSRNVLVSTTIAGASAIHSEVLITTADYAANTQISQGAVTVFRVIGDFMVTPEVVPPSTRTFGWWAVFAQDEDAALTTMSPNDGQELTDERVLAAGVWGFQSYGVDGTTGQFQGEHMRFDTKVRIKMNQTRIIWAFSNDAVAGNDVQIHGTYAVLLRGDTT